VRILIWHGYLLRGTGSNEYTRALARVLARHGHEVVVLSQEPDPTAHDLGGAATVRPALPGRLPVFVLDRYEGLEPALLPDMPRAELDAFVAAQVEAIHAAGPADLLITNHVLLGGPVGAASGLPYLVKVHGSELEYAMRGNPQLCQWARRTLEPAVGVLVGSEHIGRVVTELVGLGPERLTVATPGVDVEQMRPQQRSSALAALIEESRRDPAHHGDERLPDAGNAERLQRFLTDQARPTVVYVGKLSEQKGVHLLLEALAGLDARAVVVGFGPARADLEQQAARLGVPALFTGPLQHRHLRRLWALADVSVVPSVFPEAFGMVAAEAAATGCPPLVARHSGLAEVAAGLEAFLPQHLHLVSFAPGDVADLRAGVQRILSLSAADRAELAAGCRAAVESLWSWDSVAHQILGTAMSGPHLAAVSPPQRSGTRPAGHALPRHPAGR
jgi:glycosyltransferase involved in cell wall biosynthesis